MAGRVLLHLRLQWPGFWQTEGKRWAKDADKFTNPSGQLKSAVSQIVAPGDSDEQKARKIYAAVMKLDNTRFTRAKSEAERKARSSKTSKTPRMSGSSRAVPTTRSRSSMLPWPGRPVSRPGRCSGRPQPRHFDTSFLSLNQLDDYIAIVSLGDKEIYLDPGRRCALSAPCTGSIRWPPDSASRTRDRSRNNSRCYLQGRGQ